MENIYGSIEDLSTAKGINPQVVIEAVKDAILAAARKYYKTNEELVAEFNDQGQLQVFAVKVVTDLVANPGKEISLAEAQSIDPQAQVGGEIRYPKPTAELGRISAQLAKQVIFQKIREAERETIYKEFSGRLGEIVGSTIKRIEGPDLIVDIGRTEARLPRREQSKLESFSPGDRVRVVIKGFDKAGRGPAMIVSRADDILVKTLFEQEVPEIYDGTVQIRACAREAGERTKIAVQSRDRDVDAVGACVGMRGMRVQSIIRELRGEKIDIVEYTEEAAEMVARALSPAKISRVTLVDPVGRHLEAIVDDSQLSLAIGKRGQNVRLAAKLIGWRIDIKSEEEKRQEVETAMEVMGGAGTPVSVLLDHGLGEKLVDKLLEAGSSTVERVADMTPEQLQEISGIGPKLVERIQLAVNSFYSQFEDAGALPELAQELATARPETPPPAKDTPALAAAETERALPLTPPLMPGLPVQGEELQESDETYPEAGTDSDNMGRSDLSAEADQVAETGQLPSKIEPEASQQQAEGGNEGDGDDGITVKE